MEAPSHSGLLRRIAESVFWIGRYLERSDVTARTLDVHLRLLVEDPWAEENAACRSLLGIMGIAVPDAEPIGTVDVLDQLAYSPAATSINGAITAARENARGAREILSSEFWSSLNTTWLALPEVRRRSEILGSHVFFSWVREQTATLAGIVDLTMSRDDAWRLLVLGRNLERVDMTARLLMTRALPGAPGRGQPSWMALLLSCGANEAFLRSYRAEIEEASVIEFLLLDRLFPRSVFAALSTAEECLAELDPEQTRVGVHDFARRRLGRTRTLLEYRSTEDLLSNLPGLLRELERTCSEVSDAVASRFFQAARAMAWAQEGA